MYTFSHSNNLEAKKYGKIVFLFFFNSKTAEENTGYEPVMVASQRQAKVVPVLVKLSKGNRFLNALTLNQLQVVTPYTGAKERPEDTSRRRQCLISLRLKG